MFLKNLRVSFPHQNRRRRFIEKSDRSIDIAPEVPKFAIGGFPEQNLLG